MKLIKQSGITLVELVVTILLFLLVLTTILSFLFYTEKVWQLGKKRIELQESMTISIDRMARDIRVCDELIDTKGTVLSFNSGRKLVTYYVDSDNELTREFSGVGLPVASHIKKVEFTYYNDQGYLVTDNMASDVKQVKIVLTGGMDGINDMKLSTIAAIRASN